MLFLRCGTVTRISRERSAPIISMICRCRATRSAKSRVAPSGKGRGSGLVASAKRAMMAASIKSVFARCPSALANARPPRAVPETVKLPVGGIS